MTRQKTFAIIITMGVRWYGDDSSVRCVFFAKRNPNDHEDSSANFFYRDQISASSVRRIMRLIQEGRYMLNYTIINGPRDLTSDDVFSQHPTIDLVFDVPTQASHVEA